MKSKNSIALTIIAIFTLSSMQLDAQMLEQKLKECSEITVSLIRLQCFDRLTSNSEVQKAKPVKERVGIFSRLGRGSQNNEVQIESEEVQVESAETEVVTNNTANQEKDPEDNFGLIIRDEKDSIESTIIGDFKGWDGYTKFKLGNGQIWQQNSYGVLKVNMSNPDITIRRSRVSDTYTLKVEGLNSSVRVKRIK
jgi:hypothetical protein